MKDWAKLIGLTADEVYCDFCDNKKKCVTVQVLGVSFEICKDCLIEFVNEFEENED